MPATLLTPQTFISKWRPIELHEHAMAQEHFIDLCRLLDHPTPADADLKKRTLTNLYNARPTWLDNAHRKLDAAVFAAYGWPADPSTTLRQAQDDSSGHDLPDEEILARRLALNLARADRR
jgi:hypothetical protein